MSHYHQVSVAETDAAGAAICDRRTVAAVYDRRTVAAVSDPQGPACSLPPPAATYVGKAELPARPWGARSACHSWLFALVARPSPLPARHSVKRVGGATCLALATLPRSAFACAACFGKSDSAMAKGMNMGILSLLITVVCVLGGVASFFIYLARKSALTSTSALASHPTTPTTALQ